MATPGISHRCALCGATIRPGAESCPNCGQGEVLPIAPNALQETPPAPAYTPSPWLMQPDLAATSENLAETHTDLMQDFADVSPAETLPAPRYEPAPAASEITPLAQTILPEPAETENAGEQDEADGDPEPPVITILESYQPRKKKRRYRRLSLKDRLASQAEKLRGLSAGTSRKVSPTVSQLRHTSNSVLDRASDDPSARFLLIASLLIALAAFIFVFSFIWS